MPKQIIYATIVPTADNCRTPTDLLSGNILHLDNFAGK